MAKQTHAVQTISYGDIAAHLFLWQKAFLVVPIWGLVAIPIVGFLCRAIGGVAPELGYGVMLCLCLNYFFVDLLKRKIRVDDDYIYFGYRVIPIRSLTGIDVNYKKGKLLPSSITAKTENGNDLKLSLQGISEKNITALLKHLEVRNSNLVTAPVLNTLIKCRHSKKKMLLETADRMQLPYHSKKIIGESLEVFKQSAYQWIRVGPVIACIVFGPMWIGFFSNLYTSLNPNSWQQLQSIGLHQFLQKFFEALSRWLANEVGKASLAAENFSNNPISMVIAGGAILALVVYVLRIAFRPNLLVTDKLGIQLLLRLGSTNIPVKKIAWSQIQSAGLFKPGNNAGSQTWKIRLTKTDGKPFDIDLSALMHDDRSLLLKRMEKMVPDCQIDYELSQSMRPHAAHSYTEIWLQSLSQAPERKTLEPLQPGQTICDNRYEVMRSIGVGGQGTAYLCRDLSLKDESNTVVLKETIIPVFGDDSIRRKSLESVEKESRLLQSLDSPGIVKLMDHFVEDHRAYLVLEHIDGSSLRDVVQNQGPLGGEQTHDLALQMCDILKVLHANGVVHRDFTPDNLILNSKGKLKLIDFNVAQQLQGGATGTIVGKHAYLPPEQFRGKATSQSDLYAFGATLFFLLTGRDPEPISQSTPQEVNDQIDERLNDIVKRSTALQTNNRYKSAEEIEADLLASDKSETSEKRETITTSTSAQKIKVVEHG
ncbi:MAG: serine/threonine protein kinase [Cyanobacteria bacterium SZAS-4]|nr:serine/threonine protein kinase [Cyanobacteria bacterium SZAS-4]